MIIQFGVISSVFGVFIINLQTLNSELITSVLERPLLKS